MRWRALDPHVVLIPKMGWLSVDVGVWLSGSGVLAMKGKFLDKSRASPCFHWCKSICSNVFHMTLSYEVMTIALRHVEQALG